MKRGLKFLLGTAFLALFLISLTAINVTSGDAEVGFEPLRTRRGKAAGAVRKPQLKKPFVTVKTDPNSDILVTDTQDTEEGKSKAAGGERVGQEVVDTESEFDSSTSGETAETYVETILAPTAKPNKRNSINGPSRNELIPFAFRRPSLGKMHTGKGSKFEPIHFPLMGAGHNTDGDERFPLYGIDDIDDATRIFEAIPDVEISSANPYDKPEDADRNAKPGSIWRELLTKYKNAPIQQLVQKNESAMCLIFAVYTGNCKYLDESLENCVRRVGFRRLDERMSEKCRNSMIWRTMHNVYREQAPAEPEAPLFSGRVIDSETCASNRSNPPWVDPSKRTPAPFGPPRHCKNGALQYPIAFGTPSSQVHTRLYPKLFDFHPIPLDLKPKPLGFNDEETYQALATMSYFCMTNSRGGWDCGRHYEVMGAGCIPYFVDIHAAGPYILPHMPQKFFRDVVRMPIFSHIGYIPNATRDTYQVPNSSFFEKGVFNGRTRLKFVNESFYFKQGVALDQNWYWRSARRLLKYSQNYMTTEAMVSYVLKMMDVEHAKRILIISRHEWDNLHQAFMTGLDGLGIKTTTVMNKNLPLQRCFEHPPDVQFTNREMGKLRGNASRGGVHGNGIPWANRLRHRKHVFVPKLSDAMGKVESGNFDAAIFTYYYEDAFPFGQVSALKANTNGKVAFMDHSDTLGDPRTYSKYLAKEVYFFSRELRRAYC